MKNNCIIENLQKLGYEANFFETAKEAVEYMNSKIDNKTVGIGGSTTVKEIGLYDELVSHNEVFWHWRMESSTLSEAEIYKEAQSSEIYISSVNGIAETGEIINIDGLGNRNSACLFGHEKIYFVLGVNKIAENYEKALWRARNIAAPKNAKRINKKTPCVLQEEKCYNCQSTDRICRGLTVFWEKINSCQMEVVIINEKLGF